LFLVFTPVAWGEAEAGTDPTGEISVSGDAVDCDGTWTMPIEKTMTLTADCNDEDVNDCNVVDDEITNPDGIEWECGYGTFSGGTTGSPKDLTATSTTATGVEVKLKIKDAGNHYQDWESHQEVDSISFDVVIPTGFSGTGRVNPGCDPNLYGDYFIYRLDAVTHSCAALDFSGLTLSETVTSDGGCISVQPRTGTWSIGAGNALSPNGDGYSFCVSTCPVDANDPNCTEVWSQTYWISDPSNVVESVTITWTFSWNGGNCDVGFSRS
jgi:hypothetical protein